MGQKTVRFSDLSGQLIDDDEVPARIVVTEHPELADSPVEIEAFVDEARALEQAGVPVAIVDIYFPGDLPRRVALEAAVFDKLATDKPMSELLAAARPARRAPRSATAPAAREDRLAGRAVARISLIGPSVASLSNSAASSTTRRGRTSPGK